MDRGPQNLSLLYNENSHVSGIKLRGKEKCILRTCQQTKKLNEWVLNERQQELVAASGLGDLALIVEFVVGRHLVTAFCERWEKETNTAHFLGFEMAPSLKDVSYIIGLPVTGQVVVGEPLDLGQSGIARVCLEYLGKDPGPENVKSGLIRLVWLYNEFHMLSENPNADAIAYSTRAYLLYLLGCTVFTAPMKGFVSPRYLPLLGDFDKIGKYAWGAAALAHLYRGLAVAAEPNAKLFQGSATLLVAWIYEYLPAMRPELNNEDYPPFPRACKWNFKFGRYGRKSNSLSVYRKKFDKLRLSDVNWTPYKDIDPSILPEYCSASENISRARAWLISFNIKEIHVPERYSWQFGQEQHMPDDVPQWYRAGWSMFTDWRRVYAKEIEEYHRLVNTHYILPFNFKEVCTADRYEKWYSQVTHHQTHPSIDPGARKKADTSLRKMVAVLRKDLPIVSRYLKGQLLPIKVQNSLERLDELLGALKTAQCIPRTKGVVWKRKRIWNDMKHEAEIEQTSNQTPSLLLLSGKRRHSAPQSPAQFPQCQLIHKGLPGNKSEGIAQEIVGTTAHETPKDLEAVAWAESLTSSEPLQSSNSPEPRKRKRETEKKNQISIESTQLRRSGRLCVQIKRLRTKSKEGADPSHPISLS